MSVGNVCEFEEFAQSRLPAPHNACIDPFAYLRDVFERTCTHPVVNSRVASGQVVLYTGGKFQFGMVFNSTKYMALRP